MNTQNYNPKPLTHHQWARESCDAALIPNDECKELNVALDMVIIVVVVVVVVVVVTTAAALKETFFSILHL